MRLVVPICTSVYLLSLHILFIILQASPINSMSCAVITGGTEGIGKAVALKYLENNYSIAICARTKSKLDDLQKLWTSQYPSSKIICVVADLSVKEDVLKFSSTILEQFPKVDILINNAGLFKPGLFPDNENELLLESMMNTNLYSAYHLTNQLLPSMRSQQSGHIFNICSSASLQPYAAGRAYSITKYALLGFSENLRDELKSDKIKVTTVSPGPVFTKSWEGSGVEPSRIMQANDVANMIFTASQLSPQANIEHITMNPLQSL